MDLWPCLSVLLQVILTSSFVGLWCSGLGIGPAPLVPYHFDTSQAAIYQSKRLFDFAGGVWRIGQAVLTIPKVRFLCNESTPLPLVATCCYMVFATLGWPHPYLTQDSISGEISAALIPSLQKMRLQ